MKIELLLFIIFAVFIVIIISAVSKNHVAIENQMTPEGKDLNCWVQSEAQIIVVSAGQMRTLKLELGHNYCIFEPKKK